MPTPRERCDHIIDAIQAILLSTNGHSEHTFAGDEPLRAACYYRLVVIGEAADLLSKACAQEISLIAPNLAYSLSKSHQLRTLLAHHYHRIDPKIIWNTIRKNLPPMLTDVTALRSVLQP